MRLYVQVVFLSLTAVVRARNRRGNSKVTVVVAALWERGRDGDTP